LVNAVEQMVQDRPGAINAERSSDFGEDLLGSVTNMAGVTVLAPDAAARAAHGIALRFQRKELARGHYDLTVPFADRDLSLSSGEPGTRNLRIVSADP
jgi:hypothetical protein